VIIPPLGNEFNNMLKTTSLLSALSVFELFYTFKIKAGQTYATFEYFLACAVMFLLLTTIWGFIQAWIERKFAKGTTQSSNGPGLRARLWGLRNNSGNQGHG
jgi:polar amino acid transport system permease protein